MNVQDDVETSGAIARKLPSLVSLCQRVAISNVERLTSLGDDFRIEVVRPILQYCSAETLLRLEQATPHLTQDTSELWRSLCFKVYPLLARQKFSGEPPESWRDAFVILGELEEQRLEAAGNRLRIQREKEEQRKKDSQIKITDKLPPQKRARTWGSYQPKSLFQKTRSDTAKMQKGIYGSPLVGHMPHTKGYRSTPAVASAKPPILPPVKPSPSLNGTSGSRVTVTAVTVRRPSVKLTNTTNSLQTNVGSAPVSAPSCSPPTADRPSSGNESLHGLERRPLKPPNAKKDPMAALFMPKKRASSQLPTPSSVRSRP